jgi:hypothetical protein
MSGIVGILVSGQAPIIRKHTPRKAMGYIALSDPDLPNIVERETVMCVHCQMHWQIEPGSGKERGFCINCGGPTCGKEACETMCVPFMQAIEEMERRQKLRDRLTRG